MKKGFTLVELLAVIVILAIILAIAVPAIGNLISNARKNAFENGAKLVLKSMKLDYDEKVVSTGSFTDTFILYDNGIRTVYPSSNNLDFTLSATDGGIVRHSDGTVTLALYDGYSCVTKTRTSNDFITTTTDKATCVGNIIYKQATAPFSNMFPNGDFSSGTNGWLTHNSTLSASNNILSVLGGNGSYYMARTIYLMSVKPSNSTIYYSVNFKTLSGCKEFRLWLRDGLGGSLYNYNTAISNPQINIWHSYSAISTLGTLTDFLTINVDHTFNQLAESYGKVMEVRNVIAINLTQTYGVGNEPTQTIMNNNINKVWIDTANSNTPKRFTGGGWINY